MATPDIRNLFEQFLHIYGGQGGPSEPASEPRSQTPRTAYPLPSEAYESDGGNQPTGGVLGGSALSSAGMPWWVQALSPGGIAAGSREGVPVRPLPGRFLPMPVGPGKVVEMPNPHLERFIPQSTRYFWNAVTLLPHMLRGQLLGDQSSAGNVEENGASSSNTLPERPPNRPGGQPPWIVGPAILEEERERQRTNSQRRPTGTVDPDFRHLTRVSPPGVGPVKDAAGSYREAQAGTDSDGKPAPRVASPSLVPDQEPIGPRASSGGGTNGPQAGEKGSGGKNFCRERWEAEYNDCDRFWLKKTSRWRDACRARAGHRLRLCERNGGSPDPEEPEEYSWNDIPKDNPRN